MQRGGGEKQEGKGKQREGGERTGRKREEGEEVSEKRVVINVNFSNKLSGEEDLK